MNIDTIRVYAISKLDWIKKQQKKLQAQERETHREYLDRESHYVWGKRYLLKVNEEKRAPSVELQSRPDDPDRPPWSRDGKKGSSRRGLVSR